YILSEYVAEAIPDPALLKGMNATSQRLLTTRSLLTHFDTLSEGERETLLQRLRSAINVPHVPQTKAMGEEDTDTDPTLPVTCDREALAPFSLSCLLPSDTLDVEDMYSKVLSMVQGDTPCPSAMASMLNGLSVPVRTRLVSDLEYICPSTLSWDQWTRVLGDIEPESRLIDVNAMVSAYLTDKSTFPHWDRVSLGALLGLTQLHGTHLMAGGYTFERVLTRIHPTLASGCVHDHAVREGFYKKALELSSDLPVYMSPIRQSLLLHYMAHLEARPDSERLCAPVSYDDTTLPLLGGRAMYPRFQDITEQLRFQDITEQLRFQDITEQLRHLLARDIQDMILCHPEADKRLSQVMAAFAHALVHLCDLSHSDVLSTFGALIDGNMAGLIRETVERVVLLFPPHAPKYVGVEALRGGEAEAAPLTLPLQTQGVDTLGIQVYELSSHEYLRTHDQYDVAADFTGIQPSLSLTLSLKEEGQNVNTLRTTQLPLSYLTRRRRGVYLVEASGGGRAVRALVRIGALTGLVEQTGRGYHVDIRDEQGLKVPSASAWVGGTEYKQEETETEGKTTLGTSVIPYRRPNDGTTSSQRVILTVPNPVTSNQLDSGDGESAIPDRECGDYKIVSESADVSLAPLFACAIKLDPYAEEALVLHSHFHLDRESVVSGSASGRVHVRCTLALEGDKWVLSLADRLLDGSQLTVNVVDSKGVAVDTTLDDTDSILAVLEGTRPLTFPVPDGVTQIGVSLVARCALESAPGEQVTLTGAERWNINQELDSDSVVYPYLTRETGPSAAEVCSTSVYNHREGGMPAPTRYLPKWHDLHPKRLPLYMGEDAQPGHVIKVLGKTGEPYPYCPLSITLVYRWGTGAQDTRSVTSTETELVTDSTGRVYLGDLDNVHAITVTCPQTYTPVGYALRGVGEAEVEGEMKLHPLSLALAAYSDRATYSFAIENESSLQPAIPTYVTVPVGEHVTLPVVYEEGMDVSVAVHGVAGCVVDTDPEGVGVAVDADTGYLCVGPFTDDTHSYSVTLPATLTRCTINVEVVVLPSKAPEGERERVGGCLLKSSLGVYSETDPLLMRLGDAPTSVSGGRVCLPLAVPVGTDISALKVSACVRRVQSTSGVSVGLHEGTPIGSCITRPVHKTAFLPKSLYDARSREEGEEAMYSRQRKAATSVPGSVSLPRPGLTMAPIATGEAQTTAAKARAGDARVHQYAEECEEKCATNGLFDRGGRCRDRATLRSTGALASGTRDTPLEFLTPIGALKASVTVGEGEGVCTVTVDCEDMATLTCGTLDVVVYDTETQAESRVSIPVPSLSLPPPEAEEDEVNCSVALFDTMPKYYRYLESRAKSTSATHAHYLRDFNVLTQWSSYSTEEKERHWARLSCHDLCIALSLLDRPFFMSHIRPMVMNKAQPDCVDLWTVVAGPTLLSHRDSSEPVVLSVTRDVADSPNVEAAVCRLVTSMETVPAYIASHTMLETLLSVHTLHVYATHRDTVTGSAVSLSGLVTAYVSHLTLTVGKTTPTPSAMEQAIVAALAMGAIEDIEEEEEEEEETIPPTEPEPEAEPSSEDESSSESGSSYSIDEEEEEEEEDGACFDSSDDEGDICEDELEGLQDMMLMREECMEELSLQSERLDDMAVNFSRKAKKKSKGGFGFGKRDKQMDSFAAAPTRSLSMAMPQAAPMMRRGRAPAPPISLRSAEKKKEKAPKPKAPERYQGISQTKVYSETSWYKKGIQGKADPSAWNPFWLSVLLWIVSDRAQTTPFSSPLFLTPALSLSYSETLFALCITGLPQTSSVRVRRSKGSLIVEAGSPCMLVTRAVRAVVPDPHTHSADSTNPLCSIIRHTKGEEGLGEYAPLILVLTQEIREHAKTERERETARVVTDTVVAGRVYDVTVTCLLLRTSRLSGYRLLTQIPNGSVPLCNVQASENAPLDFNGTLSVVKTVYWPHPGTYTVPLPLATDGTNSVKAGDIQHPFFAVTPSTITVVDTPPRDVSADMGERERVRSLSRSEVCELLASGVDRLVGTLLTHCRLDQVVWGIGNEKGQRSNVWGSRSAVLDSSRNRLLHDKEFYTMVCDILQERGMLTRDLCALGFQHGDWAMIKKYCEAERDAVSQAVNPAHMHTASTLLPCDPFHAIQSQAQGFMRQLDFRPIVNERCLQLGHERRIPNATLSTHYKAFLRHLASGPVLGDLSVSLLVWLVYLLLLQERWDTAKEVFAVVKTRVLDVTVSRHTPMPMLQALALGAYMELATYPVQEEGETEYTLPLTERAAALAEDTHLLPRWRSVFGDYQNYLNRLREVDTPSIEETVVSVDADKPDADAEAAAARRHTDAAQYKGLSLSVREGAPGEGSIVRVEVEAVPRFRMRFVPTDTEALLLGHPELTQSTASGGESDTLSSIVVEHTMYIVPVYEEGVTRTTVCIPVPTPLASLALLIEASAEGVPTKIRQHSDASIEASIEERFGRVTVFEKGSSGRPVPRVYVKALAVRQGSCGKASFWKDGYTDLGGVFDYASVSASDISEAESFIVFVDGGDKGKLTISAKPPSRR
ncbi:hypothetical protein KIPB_000538, partial [Kipferlia bialata]